MLSRFHPVPERNGHTNGRTDRQTDLLYQYRASICWRAIKSNQLEWKFHFYVIRIRISLAILSEIFIQIGYFFQQLCKKTIVDFFWTQCTQTSTKLPETKGSDLPLTCLEVWRNSCLWEVSRKLRTSPLGNSREVRISHLLHSAYRQHQQSCHLVNGYRYNIIKILLSIAMVIIKHVKIFM